MSDPRKRLIRINIVMITSIIIITFLNVFLTIMDSSLMSGLKLIIFDIPALAIWILYFVAVNQTVKGSKEGVVLTIITLITVSLFSHWWLEDANDDESLYLLPFVLIYLSSAIILLNFKKFRNEPIKN